MTVKGPNGPVRLETESAFSKAYQADTRMQGMSRPNRVISVELLACTNILKQPH